MNAEFDALVHEDQQAVREAIAQVRKTGETWRIPLQSGEAYAYKRKDGGIAWGFDSSVVGRNIARGVEYDAT